MSTNVSAYSSLPRTEFRGIKDEGAVNIAMPSESLPIRLPLFASFAPWGETNRARYVDASSLTLLYGGEILNPKSPFFTHQSQFIRSHFTAGGKCLFVGLRAPGAKQSGARLVLDYVEDVVPLYERNGDNSLKLNAQGEKIPTGETIPGIRAQWRKVAIGPVSAEDPTSSFGSANTTEGTMVAADGSLSVQTPVSDVLARFVGGKGDNLGFRLIAPTINSVDAADEELQETLGAFLYRMQVVSRASAKSTAQVTRTLGGDGFVDFSFKKGTIDLDTEVEFYVDKKIIPSYESTDEANFTGFGPFEKIHVYNDEIAEMLTKFAALEAAHTGEEFADVNLFNFLTGVDINGNPYATFVVEGPAQGGLLFGEMSNHYMVGGADGDVSAANFNTVFDEMLDGVATSEIPFKNIARMPYDSIWDSGFPVDTKKKFANFLALRPDVYPHVCTQDVSKAINTPSQDASIAVTLRSHFRAISESAEFGTKACRVAMFSNAGYLINDNYDGLVPFLEFILILGARYMGAENGEMNNTYAFGRGEQNIVTRYRNHNATTRDDSVRNTDWANGLNYAEFYDMSRLFWAGMQSIYEDHTSVLHSYLNVQIACNLTRIGNIVWREMSGDSQLTDDQFLDMVNDKVTVKTTGKYDNRVDVTPNAYYTALDEALGFPWHLDIAMAGENIRTVENLAIIAQRRRTEEAA